MKIDMSNPVRDISQDIDIEWRVHDSYAAIRAKYIFRAHRSIGNFEFQLANIIKGIPSG